ncbi:hypothetical protein Pla175_19390 [Pirellulimonas nuda]|uniref:Planctomycete cytochrome C n=1 Tax=Pirellulimonas nuda TaxID=2528009 RepID=A0A518DAQ3_9BACT|nr:DUF1592 domain-containing protein [Pirellulimonas nuda]QDU88561.1 hypothetical protein Pla175_19390 [Pirellulimonas nuda]
MQALRNQLEAALQSITVACGLMALACGQATAVAGPDDPIQSLQPLTSTYCIDCHGPVVDGPEGGFSLTELFEQSGTAESMASWQKALNAIEAYEMPPDYMDQPSDEERQAMTNAIRALMAKEAAGAESRPGRAAARRLTRLEYNNTVRDLLGLSTDVFMFSERLPFDKSYFDPASGEMPDTLTMTGREYGSRYPVLLPDSGLPPDSRADHGFSNRGDAQDISASTLDQYVQLAHEIAFHPNLLTEATRAHELFPNASARSKKRAQAPATAVAAPRPKPAIVNSVGRVAPNENVLVTADGSSTDLATFQRRLEEAYRLDAGGVEGFEDHLNRKFKQSDQSLNVAYGLNANRVLELRFDSELWAVGFSSVSESSGSTLLSNKNQGETSFSVSFHRSAEDGWKGPVSVGLVLLSRNEQSGPVAVSARFSNGETKRVEIDLAAGAGESNAFVAFDAPDGSGIQSLDIDGSGLDGPYLMIDDLAFIVEDGGEPVVQVSGRELPDPPAAPSRPAKPPKVDAVVAVQDMSSLSPKERLARFMHRAFRRPVEASEVDRYFALYESSQDAGGDEEQAMRAALQGVLCSPSFLYLIHVGRTDDPTDAEGVRRLTDHELASRLSYFLWSTMPDDQLLALADSGRLSEPEQLEAQVRRMLRDERVRELSESFFVEWLRLRELWSSQPDSKAFRDFYSGPQGKRTSARDLFGEALLAVETVMVEDRPVLDLLHSDYTYVNARVARLYGFDGSELRSYRSGEVLGKGSLNSDDTWRRVRLPDARRGGVITMGATLTLTSFPTRTSPIKRGAWFLETILNRPPPPPTVAVPDIEEQEVDGQRLTLREKVELHRADPACAVCHNRIDPPGFAMESYDAIGRWREQEGDEQIDPSGSIRGLGSFDGPAEFKQLLLEDRDRFVQGFTEHLLSYALSRKLEYFDTALVDQVQAQTEANNYKLSAMISAIVNSDAFQLTTSK